MKPEENGGSTGTRTLARNTRIACFWPENSRSRLGLVPSRPTVFRGFSSRSTMSGNVWGTIALALLLTACSGSVTGYDVGSSVDEPDVCNRDGQTNADLGLPPHGCACALECPASSPEMSRICDQGRCYERAPGE